MKPPPARPAAVRQRATTASRTRTWLAHHRHCAAESLARMRRTPVAAFMTLAVMAIALILPTLLYLASLNLSQLGAALEGTSRVTVYLEGRNADERASALADELRQHRLVADIEIITSAQAAEDFTRWSGLGDVMVSLEGNPLPASLLITPVDRQAATARQLGNELAQRDDILTVHADHEWAERLDSVLTLVERAVWSLSGILAVAVLFVAGNSINTLITRREAEIRVMALMGATRAYVARPFLYTGFWYGLIGGAIAWVIVQSLMMWLQEPATSLLSAYGNQYVFYGLTIGPSLVLLGGSSLLGWAGARLSVSRQLSRHAWL